METRVVFVMALLSLLVITNVSEVDGQLCVLNSGRCMDTPPYVNVRGRMLGRCGRTGRFKKCRKIGLAGCRCSSLLVMGDPRDWKFSLRVYDQLNCKWNVYMNYNIECRMSYIDLCDTSAYLTDKEQLYVFIIMVRLLYKVAQHAVWQFLYFKLRFAYTCT